MSRRRWIAGLGALVTLASASMAGTVIAAPAPLPLQRIGEFAMPPKDGSVSHHQHLAVRQSTGDLFVANTVDDRIDVYAPTATGAELLTSFGEGTLTDPDGLAIDQSDGAVYVADAGNSQIVKYTSDAASVPTFTRVNAPGFTSPAQGITDAELGRFDAALAVAPDGDLWVADPGSNRIKRFHPDGSYANAYIDGAGSPAPLTGALDGSFNGLMDVAVDSTGDVIAIDQSGDVTVGGGTSRAERFSAAGVWEAEFSSVYNPGAVAIHPDDRVVVSSDQDSYNTVAPITVNTFAPDGTALETVSLPTDFWADGLGAPGIWSAVTGIGAGPGATHRAYVATDTPDGAYGQISIQAFEIPQRFAPTIRSASAEPIQTQAELHAVIDPGRSDTTYHFEWGPTDSYGTNTADKTIPADSDRVNVSARIGEGLIPGTTYHYRVVATNEVDTTVGPDRTFTTLAAPGADGCPNAAIRGPQKSTFLPECRAWEQVSPIEKNGGDAGTNPQYDGPSQISVSGEAAAYTSTGSFAGARVGTGNYLSTRGPQGWSTQNVLPPFKQDVSTGNYPRVSNFFSADLSEALVMSAGQLTADAPADARNIFVRDNASGTYELVTRGAPLIPGVIATMTPVAVGVSDDFRHALVQSNLPLTADSPLGAPSNLYEWAAGTPDTFRLVGVLPGETVAPDGAAAGSNGANIQGNLTGSLDHAMSDDGSRIFFSSPAASTNLYMRENGERTIQISANGLFWTATPDGSEVLFTTGLNGVNGGLYRQDVATGVTTDLSPGADPQVQGVVGASDDLSRVYFIAAGRLVAGKGVSGGNNLYLSEDGAVTFIATLAAGPIASLAGNVGFPQDGQGAVTADGSRLAFATASRLTDYDNTSPNVACPVADGSPGPCTAVYVYDHAKHELSCASCSGGPGYSLLKPPSGGKIKFFDTWRHAQQSFSHDGSRLFFQSTKALVPEDVNGVSDVYEWVGGQARLISGGAGEGTGSLFMGASSSGDDAFFTTRDRLVGHDRDDGTDVYVARVNGGFPEPVAPEQPCSGEACRGLPSAAPVSVVAGSVTFIGPGNATPARAPTRAAAKVSKPKTIAGTSGRLRITVPGKGRLTTAGSGLRSTSKSITKAGTYNITVVLSAKAAGTLRKHHRFTTTARVAFTPTGGKATTVRVRLTFSQSKPKPRAGRSAVGTSNGRGR